MISLAVSPVGALYLRDDPDAPTIPDAAALARITEAFHRAALQGALHLGARELDAVLPPAFAWLRSFARLFVSRLCALPELDALGDRAQVPLPPDAELDALAASVPAMRGAEYVSAACLAAGFSFRCRSVPLFVEGLAQGLAQGGAVLLAGVQLGVVW